MRLTRASTACATNVGEGAITTMGCSACGVGRAWSGGEGSHPPSSHGSGDSYLVEQDQLPQQLKVGQNWV